MYRIIFEHHPKQGQETAFIAQWKKGSDVIQTYPGAQGTKLFRNSEKPGILYAMADWENMELRNSAMKAIRTDHDDWEHILHGHETYLDRHEVLGEFECIGESYP